MIDLLFWDCIGTYLAAHEFNLVARMEFKSYPKTRKDEWTDAAQKLARILSRMAYAVNVKEFAFAASVPE